MRRVHEYASYAVLLMAAGLRLPWIESLPAPAGDESNWLNLGLALSRGDTAGLNPNASFVTNTFGRLLSLGFTLHGPNVASARLVPVALVLLALVALLALAFHRGNTTFALVTVALLGLHPWSVAWSRTVSVPYSLSFVLAALAPVAWVYACDIEDRRYQALGLVLAAQLWALALHFSPLALTLPVACGVWTLIARRSLLRAPGLWLALAFAALHAFPLLLGIRASMPHQPKSDTAITAVRFLSFARITIDYLSGESTVRHFTSGALEPTMRAVTRVLTAICVSGVLLFSFASYRRRRAPSFASEVALLGALLLVASWLFLPIALRGARPWWLPSIAADRYGFGLIAPFALLVGALAQSGRRALYVALAIVVFTAAVPTARMAHAALLGGGPDLGIEVERGGGWRGWRMTRNFVSPAEAAFREGASLDAPVTYLITDWFSFQALQFLVNASPRLDDVAARRGTSLTSIAPDHYVVLATWDKEMFPPRDRTARTAAATRKRFRQRYEIVRERKFEQPDGRPMLEVLVGRMRAPANVEL